MYLNGHLNDVTSSLARHIGKRGVRALYSAHFANVYSKFGCNEAEADGFAFVKSFQDKMCVTLATGVSCRGPIRTKAYVLVVDDRLPARHQGRILMKRD